MQDARFDQLFAAWREAEEAVETYVRQPEDCLDTAVRRMVVEQLQAVARRRYGAVCKYMNSVRRKLPRL